MTEIKARTVQADGYAALDDCIIEDRELENLYAYLKEKELEREQDLISITCKVKHMEDSQARLYDYYRRMHERLEARNQDLDRVAGLLEKM